MIEIGCQTYSLRHQRTPEMLESVRKAGFRTIELWLGHADYANDPGSAPAIRRAAERIGVTVQAYSIGGLLGQPLPAVEDRLERAFAYAAQLGVALVTGIVDRQALPGLDALCRRTGIRFALENHWYAEFARAGDFRALAAMTPLVGVTLDTGHLAAAGEDPLTVRRALGARLFNVHLKDVVVPGRFGRLVWRRPRMECRTIGAGQVALRPFLAALARGTYGGCLAVEDERPEVPLSELHASLRTCTRWLRAAAMPSADVAVASVS